MITRLRLWVIVFLLGGVLPSLIAQTFTEQKNTYPLSADGSKYVVNGFIPFSPMIDESIYANALLWTIKNVCSAQRDGITEVSIPAKSFSCNLVLTSQADAKQKEYVLLYGPISGKRWEAGLLSFQYSDRIIGGYNEESHSDGKTTT